MPTEPAVATPEEAPEKPLPSLYLSGEDLDNFNLHDCHVGDEYTATVHFRVSGADDPTSGDASKRLEISSMDNVQPVGAEMSHEDLGTGTNETPPGEEPVGDENPVMEGDLGVPDAEEKMLGYKRPKKFGKRLSPADALGGSY